MTSCWGAFSGPPRPYRPTLLPFSPLGRPFLPPWDTLHRLPRYAHQCLGVLRPPANLSTSPLPILTRWGVSCGTPPHSPPLHSPSSPAEGPFLAPCHLLDQSAANADVLGGVLLPPVTLSTLRHAIITCWWPATPLLAYTTPAFSQ